VLNLSADALNAHQTLIDLSRVDAVAIQWSLLQQNHGCDVCTVH